MYHCVVFVLWLGVPRYEFGLISILNKATVEFWCRTVIEKGSCGRICLCSVRTRKQARQCTGDVKIISESPIVVCWSLFLSEPAMVPPCLPS